MAGISSQSNCPIEMSFDLDESLTLLPQQYEPCRGASEYSNAWGIGDMPTVNATSADVCSICVEGFRRGEGGKQVPCGHVYHEACIAEWSLRHNSCPLCRSKIFQH